MGGFLILFGALFLIVIGIPIGIALGSIGAIYMFLEGIPLGILSQQAFQGANDFVLTAIPFFLLTGEILKVSGLSKRLLDFADALVGHLTGALGHVNIVVSMLFAGISGSAVADTSAVGTVIIPEMVRKGYERNFSVAVTGASSVIGPIIPPSMPMIIAAYLARQSVAKMFIGGAIPGIIFGLGMMIVVYIISKKKGYRADRGFSISLLKKSFLKAILPLLAPVIILGGIFQGIFTATQAGAVAALYCSIIAIILKSLDLSKFKEALINAVTKTGSVMFVVAMARTYSWIMTRERVPSLIYSQIIGRTENEFLIMLMLFLALLIIGCFLSATPAVILTIPVLVPVVESIGIDPLYFAVFATIVLCMGTITPPVGLTLYLVSSIGEAEVEDVVYSLVPFYILFIIVNIMLLLFPSIIMWLPSIM